MKRLIPVLSIFLLLAAGMLISACNGKKENEFTIKAMGENMSDMHFDVKEIKVPEKQRIRIKLINASPAGAGMEHNIVVVRPKDVDATVIASAEAGKEREYLVNDNDKINAGSSLAEPGKETMLIFDAPAKGEYLFISTVPGQYPMMRGKLIVQ